MSMFRAILFYIVLISCTIASASSLLWLKNQQSLSAPGPASLLPEKTAYYITHADVFNLIFLGDSRTYCAFHPELLDPLLGTRSFNVAHWTHWLPTQYAQIQDLVDSIPAQTTVVYSIAQSNFVHDDIKATYPIGLRNVPQYLTFGIPLPELATNLTTMNPLTYLLARRGEIFERVKELAARRVRGNNAPPATPIAFPGLVKQPGERQGVLRTEVQAPESKPVAVSNFMAGGGYLLEELDPAYFRAKQVRSSTGPSEQHFQVDPSRWVIFIALLDLLRQHRINVVVNVLEEAPFRYRAGALLQERAFMNGPVRRAVEERGFVFLRINLDRLTDADYFDNNHLNSRGVEKYTALFSSAVATHLVHTRAN